VGAGALAALRHAAPWSGVLCLNYHRIGSGAESVFDRGLWSADEESFDAQVRFLCSHFDVVAPPDLDGILKRRRGRHVLITFDDGYRDNYTAAFPILKSHGAVATFFVATGFIDDPALPWWDEIAWMVRTSTKGGLPASRWLAGPVPFDDPDREAAVRTCLRAFKSMPAADHAEYLEHLAGATGSGRCPDGPGATLWMTWEMLREMRSAGMTIGGHTVNHPVLARLPQPAQRDEIVACGRRLAEELGEPMRYFSYPVGGLDAFDAGTRACLRDTGVHYAFSYYGGYRTFDDWDDMDVRRIAIESELKRRALRAIATLPWLFGRSRRLRRTRDTT